MKQRINSACAFAFSLLLPMLPLGCKSNPQFSHAAFTAAVTLGEQIAIETHPEAVPVLRVATPVVCSVANGTNVSAASIVAQLEAAGINDPTAKIIINGSLALFNIAISGLSTNSSELRLFAQDLCAGMTAGLPPVPTMAIRRSALASRPPPTSTLPPHLK